MLPNLATSMDNMKSSVHYYGTHQVSTVQCGLWAVRYFGAKYWNDAPGDIKDSPSACSFRQKRKVFFLENNDQ